MESGKKTSVWRGEGNWEGKELGSGFSKLEPWGNELWKKMSTELTVTADVLSLPMALVAQAVLTKAECMQLPKEQC